MRQLLTLLFAGFTGLPAIAGPAEKLVAAARPQIGVTTRYDSSYQRIAYPSGDMPIDRGVCTDVVIRAYRRLGIDLQERVLWDMRVAWREYPHPAKWGLKCTDRNIDHCRGPNLDMFSAGMALRLLEPIGLWTSTLATSLFGNCNMGCFTSALCLTSFRLRAHALSSTTSPLA
jgi:uncharacterized protein YijF (DUF1287 family)